MKRARLLSALFFASALPAWAQAACAPDRVFYPAEGGPIEFAVEIADDEAERARGLMFREDLPRGQGMLFIYPEPVQVSFWMRNTLIPLDIIFMDEKGVIRRIHPNARPHDETPIPGASAEDRNPQRRFVLEIAGGEASRLGLHEGMAMAHPTIPATMAVVPCK